MADAIGRVRLQIAVDTLPESLVVRRIRDEFRKIIAMFVQMVLEALEVPEHRIARDGTEEIA